MPENTVKSRCAGCGMTTETPREYDPFAVCKLFDALHNSETVRGNIRAVIEYGMKAERLGVSIDTAMSDFGFVIGVDEQAK